MNVHMFIEVVFTDWKSLKLSSVATICSSYQTAGMTRAVLSSSRQDGVADLSSGPRLYLPLVNGGCGGEGGGWLGQTDR